MVKQLVVLGDSFCHGIGTASVFKNSNNHQYAFGKHVADHLKLDYVNLAEPGISILRTVELGHKYLSLNQSLVDTVIIGWTHPQRIGLYSDQSMLQILSSYCLLGNTSETDVFVESHNNVKFLTNSQNQQYLKLLPKLHRLAVENNFFSAQESLSITVIECFRAWLDTRNIRYLDFEVFNNVDSSPKMPISFNDVMDPKQHPTIDEQRQFSEIFIRHMK
jgi:hypothetical protein